MSSILDALKKLEEEKAASQRTNTHTIDQGEAEHDLMGPNTLGRALTGRMSPLVLVVAGVVFSVALVAVSVGAAVYVAQSQMAGESWMAASAPSADEGPSEAVAVEEEEDNGAPADESEHAVSPADDEPDAPEPVAQDEEPPQPEAMGAPPAPQEPESVTAEEEPALTVEQEEPATDTESASAEADAAAEAEIEDEPSEPEPEPEPEREPAEVERPELARLEQALEQVRQETAAERAETEPERLSTEVRQAEDAAVRLREQREQRAERNARTPEAPPSEREQYSPPSDNQPVDMDSLPTLTQTARREHGLEDLQINMLRAPSENRPRPSALINYQVVYVGETIPGANARLLAVSVRGIAIEVNGARYYVRR